MNSKPRPERLLTLLLIATGSVFAFLGSAIGALTLASLSGVQGGLGLALFPSHPYLQIYGFVFEFVIGVEYSLLPRFKVTPIPSVLMGYLTYASVTAANVVYLLSSIFAGDVGFLDQTGSVLLLVGSLAFAYQGASLSFREKGGFPEANPLMLISSSSLVLSTILLLLEQEGVVNAGGVFSPPMVYLTLLGFAGSMIYAVEIRSVSFRQCNYRQGWAKISSVFQALAVEAVFLGAVANAQLLYVMGAVSFLVAAVALLLSIKILELAHPLMYRPAMTRMHFRIMRYNEVSILLASVWLLLGSILGILGFVFGVSAFAVKDSFIHSIAIGFIGSSITCFAPMLLPGLLGRKGPVTGLSFGPILLLNMGAAVRIFGDLQASFSGGPPLWESLTGPLVIGAMIWFLVMIHGVGRREQPAQPHPGAEGSGLDSLKNVADARLTVRGRKTGREITLPIWFVYEGGEVLLLPIRGRLTQWYRNALSQKTVTFRVGQYTFNGTPEEILEAGQMQRIVALFKDKYGERNFSNYYANRIDVAVKIAVGQRSST